MLEDDGKLKIVDVWCEEFDHIHVIPIFDIQVGNPACDLKKLKDFVEYIKAEPNNRTLGGGDWLETHFMSNKATQMNEVTELSSLHKAKYTLARIFKPIADRFDAAVGGNHEQRATNKTGDYPVYDTLIAMGIPEEEVDKMYDDQLMLVRYHVGKDSRHSRPVIYKALIAHGWGGARTAGGQINKVEEWPRLFPDCDFYIQGHEHNTGLSQPDCNRIPDKGETVNKQKRFCLSSPAFCDWSRFEKGKALRLANVGAMNIRLDGKRRDIHVKV